MFTEHTKQQEKCCAGLQTGLECNCLLSEMALRIVSIDAPELAELQMNNTSSLRKTVINSTYRHSNGENTV